MDLDLFADFDGPTGKPAPVVPMLVEEADGEERKSPSKRKRIREDVKQGPEDAGGKKRVGEGRKGKKTKAAAEQDASPLVGGAARGQASSKAYVVADDASLTREDGTVVKSFSVYPSDWKPDPDLKIDPRPAKTYPFVLDPFQKRAVDYISRNESVLVSAHTSAGKTVCAEYAIALCLRNKQKVIYTSPIKALSNQKFRDLSEEFESVGLMTGDVTINPEATCLIMTTEILRSMLYRGSEIMREVAWVVYDEIHYMRDKSRGVVWEESIILLPHKVRFVFLSATIPNAKEFVSWVARMHHQPCHVVYTDFRPVPLQHYIFPAGGDGLHLVVDDKGRFREDNFQRAMATLQGDPEVDGEGGGKSEKGLGKKKGQVNSSDLSKVVKLIMQRDYDPVIVFSFAKRECEAHALQMSKLDFNNDEEKELVHQVFVNAMESLSDDDRQLPQVQAILPLLKRGVGIHHGGLLPILKEVIEILFQEGLLKCLFATETFSIGLNMPARTVVFTNTQKFDGTDFRWITSGEYIQMSGRAGRRGKDDRGIVIQMLDEKMDPTVAKNILYGEADALYSSYHISYNMLLNMMRVEGADPEYLVRSSFHQYQQEQEMPALEQQADEMEEQMRDLQISREAEVAEYHSISQQLKRLKREMLTTERGDCCVPFIQTGRLVKVQKLDGGEAGDFGWGPVLNLSKERPTALGEAKYVVDVLLWCRRENGQAPPLAPDEKLLPGVENKEGSFVERVPVGLMDIEKLTAIRVHMPKDINTKESRTALFRSLAEIHRRFPDGPPEMDPIRDLGIAEESFMQLVARVEKLQTRMLAMALHKDPERDQLLSRYEEKVSIAEAVKVIRKKAKAAQATVMKDEMKRMKRVMRRLGHCDSDGVIQIKGRVACEINTCDELLVTELMFNSVFSDLTVPQTVALLSCLVVGEGKPEEGVPSLQEQLQGPYRQVQEAARHVAKVRAECKLEIDVEEYVNSFAASNMELTFAWCEGKKFVEIMKLTDMFEGSVIRVIRRLDELLRQLAGASHAIGNMELKEKFEAGANAIRRDIVFAASLYL